VIVKKDDIMMSKNLFIEDFSIENFRAFKSFHASGFGQVNLITGKNNAGKTTFLEALFLNLGPANPTLWININGRRGLERISPKQTTAPYLFYRTDTRKPIIFKVRPKYHSPYQLCIELREPTLDEISSLPRDLDGVFSLPTSIVAKGESAVVELTYSPEKGQPIATKSIISVKGIFPVGERVDIFPDSVFVSSSDVSSVMEDAKRYDLLNKTNQVQEFEELLQIVEHDLKRTSLGIENDVTMVHGDVGYGLVPITLLGSGCKRLSSVFLSLTYARQGVVLIDEIENSFHHSIIGKVWLAIARFSKKNGTQIFATTHSDECIRAAFEAFTEVADVDFRAHRLEREGERIESFTFERNQLKAALETGWDIR
jgi:predicted ATP-dependent endonuclease of OLD family